MKHLHKIASILLGGVMILHGIAHVPAVLGSWGLATFEDVSIRPNVWLTNASNATLTILGTVWLLAAAGFVVAGLGAIRRLDWWPVTAATALVFSVPMTLLWHDDAAVGLALNAALLAIMAGWYLVGAVRKKIPAHTSEIEV